MSALTLSRVAIKTPQQGVAALLAILAKAEKHPNAASFPEARLSADMLPLSFQVHCVSDNAFKSIARTTGTEPPTLDREELKTIADMQKRLQSASEALDKADTELVNKREGETVTLGLGPGKSGQMTSMNYILGYVLPNLYFHLNMAYAILRKEGVEVGKQDYLASFLNSDLTML